MYVWLGINNLGLYAEHMQIPIENQHIHPEYIDLEYPPHDIGSFEFSTFFFSLSIDLTSEPNTFLFFYVSDEKI